MIVLLHPIYFIMIEFDKGVLDKFCVEMDDDAKTIVGMFISDLKANAYRMKSLFEDGDFATLSKEAHSLKGLASIFGLITLYDDCLLIEKKPSEAGSVIKSIAGYVDEVIRVLRKSL